MGELQQTTDAIKEASEATKDLSAPAQEAALQAVEKATPRVPDPDQATANRLWLIFVPSIVALSVMFGVFMFLLIQDDKQGTDPALVGQALTFVLGVLSGLFVKSPVK